jgi:hypothetical protein
MRADAVTASIQAHVEALAGRLVELAAERAAVLIGGCNDCAKIDQRAARAGAVPVMTSRGVPGKKPPAQRKPRAFTATQVRSADPTWDDLRSKVRSVMRMRDIGWSDLARAINLAESTTRMAITRKRPPSVNIIDRLTLWVEGTGDGEPGHCPHPMRARRVQDATQISAQPTSQPIPLAPPAPSLVENPPASEPDAMIAEPDPAELARALKAKLHVAHLSRASVAARVGVDVEVLDAVLQRAPVAPDEGAKVRAYLGR